MTVPTSSTEWSAPKIYQIDSEVDLQELIRCGQIQHVIDPVDYISNDLFELHHPDLMHDDRARADFIGDIASQGVRFGRWVHYPWHSKLVRFAESDDHYALRTYRNRNLVTKEEQRTLHGKKIAVFGLSVGSNVIDRTIQTGIGNEYLLFDHDRMSPTNLNRIHATMAQVGLLKTTIAGRKIAELDPYVLQRHFTSGYDRYSDEILRANRPDVIVEEVDDLRVKARLRNIAKELRVPLVMAGDVGDRSTLDVERHDLEEVPPFNGKLSRDEAVSLLTDEISDADQINMLIKMLGRENISQALLESVMLKGKELAGTPQLGTTAAIGGAVASVAIREIFLQAAVESGASVIDVTQVISPAPEGSTGTARRLRVPAVACGLLRPFRSVKLRPGIMVIRPQLP